MTRIRLPELIASLQPGEEVQIFFGDRTVIPNLVLKSGYNPPASCLAFTIIW